MTVFTCEASALAKVLRHVNEVQIGTKETVPMLRNVKIDVADGKASFTRTNFDGMVTRTIPVEVEANGVFTVEAAKFSAVVGTFDSGSQVKLSEADGFLTMTAGRSKTRYATLPATDFPTLSLTGDPTSFDVGEDFMIAVKRVSHAAATDDVRHALLGVSLQFRDGQMHLAATDGSRMAYVTTAGHEMPDIILPNAAVALLLSLAADVSYIDMAVADNGVMWTFGDVVITHKVIDNKFPDYNRLIRSESPLTVKVDTASVRNALARIAILAGDKERSVRLDIAQDKLTISTRGDSKDGSDELPCEAHGEPMQLAVRASLLREGLAALDAPDFELALLGHRDPIMVTTSHRPEALLVIMPMVN